MAKKNSTSGTKAAPTGASNSQNLIALFEKAAEEIIVGREEPHIYAFQTNCVPNALKVGDTYRRVDVRLSEWEKYYSNLSKVLEESAFANPNHKGQNDFTYFRDYSVHDYLKNIGKYRLQDTDFLPSVYKSTEFFRDTLKADVEKAIKDIQNDYKNNTGQYQFYTEEGLPAKTKIKRTEKYKPRDIQKEAINNFSKALKNRRSNLLMYAVMRFGKTFTAMCCAEKMKAKVVVIVSAKKDVKESWHQIVMGHKNFKGYEFFDADVLTRNPNAITEYLKEDPKKNKVAIFLTLQDLSGKGPKGKAFKERHKELFGKEIDLLIVDETHFGARAEHYGKVLQDPKYIKDTTNGKKLDEDDFVETNDGDEVVKAFDAKVKLHLSGTPYRILMGSEFEKEDIVAFFQYSDIVAKKKEWDEDVNNMDKDEWKNDYYGFPEMVRFAFHPNKSARDKLEKLRKDGYTYALSALLKPKSIDKDSKNDYQKFENEKEVLDLLNVIDGKESDDQLFSFLNYPKLQKGKMCRHIVMVLPYKASCDAMQTLINKHRSKFINLKDYNIINISGVNVNSSKDVQCSTIVPGVKYKSIRGNLVRSVRNFITACEKEGQKTLTLTVNRMLTGCTVPEWDTMLYMKDTSSPQEYDQAIFRLQNPYTKTYCVKGANGKPKLDKNRKPIIIKKDMKPQTLLVDFDPMRLFLLQEHKAHIYNVNTQNIGNSKLEDRIATELRISPLLTIDPDGNIVKVTATNILEKVSQYHYDRGIREEVDEIPIDMGLYENDVFRDAISKENEIGSKAGLSIPAHEGDETDTKLETKGDKTEENKNENADSKTSQEKPIEEKIWEKKLKSYFVKILLYAYLTDDEVKSLHDILNSLDRNDDNQRIAKHLGIEKCMLQILLGNINRLGHCEMIRRLDYKIQEINKLSHNTELSAEKQVEVALCKFGKLGDAMVITPANITNDMVALFPEAVLKTKDVHMLDIAATSGEFAMALYRRMKNLGIKDNIIKESIYSIPKSSICYELTRKVYKLLGLNIDNIAEKFDAFDLLKVKDGKNKIDYNRIKKLLGQNKKFTEITLKETVNPKDNNMIKFNAIVGNPPYQEITAKKETDNGQKRTKSIFHYFQMVSDSLGEYISLIYPGGRWIHRAGKGMAEFGLKQINDPHLEKLIFYPNANDLFTMVGISDGISIVIKNMSKKTQQFTYEFIQDGNCQKIEIPSPGENLIPLNPSDLPIVNKIVKKVKERHFVYLDKSVLSQKLFSIESDFVERNPTCVREYTEGASFDKNTEIKLFTNDKAGSAGRTKWYIVPKALIKSSTEYINKWKVIVSSAHPGGQENRSQQLQIVDNHSAFGRSRVALKTFDTKKEAQNFLAYAKSKFIRFAFLMTDESLTSLAKLVPDIGNYKDNNGIINFKKDIDDQLFDLFEITKKEQKYIQKILSMK